MMTEHTNTTRYNQTDGTGQTLSKGDWVEIDFSADGEDLDFITYIDCGGLPCREVITPDARYHYVYGKHAQGKPLTASLRGEGATYRCAFPTSKGKVQIILDFYPDAAGHALKITHLIPDRAPLIRDFVRECAVAIEKIAA